MKTTTTVKTMKKTITSRTGSGYTEGAGPGVTTTTTVISGPQGGQSHLRHSLRGSGSGKIWKKTVPGKKYEFAEKLKEKKNYIMYHSGMGHEKNVIEEVEQIPQPEEEKVVEEKQVIDNYEYYESKNLKKKENPRRISITRHSRLSSPFERTIVKKYASSSSKPQKTSVTSTNFKNGYGGESGTSIKKYSYNSFTTKQQKNKTVTPSKLYETYKPSKNSSSYIQTKTITTTTNNAPVKSSIDEYITKSKISSSKYSKRGGNISNYVPKYQSKSNYTLPETESKKIEDLTKTETTQDGDYLIKTTVTKQKIGENSYGSNQYGESLLDKNYENNIKEETEEINKEFETETKVDIPKTSFEEPFLPYEESKPEYSLIKSEDTTKLYEYENDQKTQDIEEIPKSYERAGFEETNITKSSEYDSYVAKPGFIPNGPGFMPNGPGFGPNGPGFGPNGPGFGPNGPGFGPYGPGFNPYSPYGPGLPGFGPGPYGVIHKPTCPLYRANLEAQRRRYMDNSFSGSIHKEITEINKYGSVGSQQRGGSESSFDKRNMTTKKSSGSSSYGIRTSRTEGGDNYQYLETKEILKKKKYQPTTIHHRRGEIIKGFISTNTEIPKKRHKSSSFAKTITTQSLSNLKSKYTSGDYKRPLKTYVSSTTKIGNKYNLGKSYNTIKTTLSTTSGVRRNVGKSLGSKTYTDYKKYVTFILEVLKICRRQIF